MAARPGRRGITPDDVDDVVTSGITLLRLVPDDVVPAVGRQLGFWGGDPAAGDRAGRALARVQGMLGVDAVVTAVPVGGRTPAERVQWVPWGEHVPEAVDVATRDPPRRGRVRCRVPHPAACSTRRGGRAVRRRRRAGHGLGPR